MTVGLLDQIIRQKIADELGFPESTKIRFSFRDCDDGIEARLPTPAETWIRHHPGSKPLSIIAKGETLDDAIEKACATYRLMATGTEFSKSPHAPGDSPLQ